MLYVMRLYIGLITMIADVQSQLRDRYLVTLVSVSCHNKPGTYIDKTIPNIVPNISLARADGKREWNPNISLAGYVLRSSFAFNGLCKMCSFLFNYASDLC